MGRGGALPTILVVDDHADKVELICRRLTRRGFSVLGASSGAEGIALAHERKPDLVIMDVQMPGMDGHEAASILKKDEQTRAIPIIIVTADAQPVDRERAMAAGADAYMSKPVDFPCLLETIGQLLPPAACN